MAVKFNAVVTSDAPDADITSEGDKALITKGYADANYSGGGGGGTTPEISIGQYSSNSTANISTTSLTIIPFNTTDSITDTDNYSLSGGRVTITDAGTYLIFAMVSATSAAQRAKVHLEIFKNGTSTNYRGSGMYGRNSSEATTSSGMIQAYIDCAAGDIIDIRGLRGTNQTGAITMNSGDSIFSLHKVTGALAPTGVSANTSTATSGAVDLSNVAGMYYTALRTSGDISVASSPAAVVGGFAHLRISYSTEPNVTGSGIEKMAGADFIASTEMKMIFYNDGSNNYYYFLEI